MTLEELLADIRERKAASAFGIGVASVYVSAMGSCLDGAGLCPLEVFKLASADRWQKELADASGRLVYSDESTTVFEKSVREGGDIAAGAVLEYDCILSSKRQDRDRDIVEQKGGLELDPRQPALWQHIQLSPIGKMVRMLEQTDTYTKCRYAIADTALGRDAATLVKFGALRKSIGFKPSEFSPLEIVKNAEGRDVVRGWHIKKAIGLEGSLVSIPANADANILATYAKEFDGVATAFSRDALKEPSVKHWAKGLYDRRPVQVPGADIGEKNCGTGAGGFKDGNTCGGGGGGKSTNYADMDHGTKTLSVAKNGQITLKKPKTAADAIEQIKAMEKIVEVATKDFDRIKGMEKNHPDKAGPTLRLAHATSQLQRSLGFAKKMLGKGGEEELRELMESVIEKFGVQPTDPDDGDPEIDKAFSGLFSKSSYGGSSETDDADGKKKPGKCRECRESGKDCDCHSKQKHAAELLIKGLAPSAAVPSVSSHPFPAGSFEAIQSQLRAVAREYLISAGVPFVNDSYVDLFATMADSAIFLVDPYSPSRAARKLYRVSYEAKDGAAVPTGAPTEVVLDVSVVEKALAAPPGVDPKRIKDAAASQPESPASVARKLAAKSLIDPAAAEAVRGLAPIIKTLEVSPAAAQMAALLAN